jgi:hypothetical protein
LRADQRELDGILVTTTEIELVGSWKRARPHRRLSSTFMLRRPQSLRMDDL